VVLREGRRRGCGGRDPAQRTRSAVFGADGVGPGERGVGLDKVVVLEWASANKPTYTKPK
jgi:hypothetical protein